MKELRVKSEPVLQLSALQRVVELARPWLLFLLYLVAAARGIWLLAIPLAVATCLAAFVQMHDAIHRALGFSKKAHGTLLTMSALLLLKSGHGMQVTHLRHHGRCLSEDDPEGRPATWPLLRVMLEGPFHILTMRLDALRIAPRTKWMQLLETAATMLILLIAIWLKLEYGSSIGLVYWAVAAAMSATMPLWAAYLPHRLAPRNPAIRAAARLSRIWTPVVSSFAYHHVHHAFPKVPTALLPVAACSLKLPEACQQEH